MFLKYDTCINVLLFDCLPIEEECRKKLSSERETFAQLQDVKVLQGSIIGVAEAAFSGRFMTPVVRDIIVDAAATRTKHQIKVLIDTCKQITADPGKLKIFTDKVNEERYTTFDQ